MPVVYIIFAVLVMISTLFSCTRETSNTRKVYFTLCFLLIGIITAFRYTPQYADYNNYVVEYNLAANMTLGQILTSKAVVMFLISKFLNFFSNNAQMFFIFTGLFITWSFLRWINKYSSNPYVSVVAFWGLLYWQVSVNIVRQYMGISVLLFAFDYFSKEKISTSDYIKIIILVLIAIGFHPSSVLMILGIVLMRRDVLQLKYSSFIKVVLLYILLLIVMAYGYEWYYTRFNGEGDYGTSGANALGIILPAIIFFCAFLDRNFLLKQNRYNKFYINASLITFLLVLISTNNMLIFQRIAIYFSVYNILLIPELSNSYLYNRNYSIRSIFCLVCITIYYMLMIYFGKVIYIDAFNWMSLL